MQKNLNKTASKKVNARKKQPIKNLNVRERRKNENPNEHLTKIYMRNQQGVSDALLASIIKRLNRVQLC